ncbi:MAG: sortase [Patescibacteria group bacterium]
MTEPKKAIFGETYSLKKSKWRDGAFSLLHQAFFAILIFIVLFVAMNWAAISQIAQWEWTKATTQIAQTNVLHDFTKKEKPAEEKPLPIITNKVLAEKQVPDLMLEIAPPDKRLIIPRINKNVPIVAVSSQNLIKRDWEGLEKDMQKSLQHGIIHYPGTAFPGNPGNVVLTGHSSYFPWDQGRFKDVFALLHDVQLEDKIVLFSGGKKYLYTAKSIYEVKPADLKVLQQTPDNRLTLITCTPLGTNLRRLVVEALLTGIES